MESAGISPLDWHEGTNFACFISYLLMFSITASEKLNSSGTVETENGNYNWTTILPNDKLFPPKTAEYAEEYWNMVISTIMIAAGGIFVGIMMEVNGRKKSMQLNVILAITGLAFISFHKMTSIIFLRSVGHLITKFAAGMEASIVVYIAESYLPTRRALFLAGLLPVMILAEFRPRIHHFFGDVLSERTEASVLIVILVVCIYLSKFCPESPVWLKNKNAFEPVDGIEMADVSRNENKLDLDGRDPGEDQQPEIVVYVRKLWNLYAWKHFLVLAGIFTKITLLDVGLSEFLDDYRNELLFPNPAVSEQFDSSEVGILPGQARHLHEISYAVVLVSSLIGIFVVELVDRKVLSGAGWFCVTVSSMVGCVYEVVYNGVVAYYRPTRFCFIPILCIWASKGFLTIGGRMIVIVMLGELFPSSIRGFISGLLWSFMVMVAFVVEEFVHPFLKSRMSTQWMFAMYAGMASQMFIFGAFAMPETRGKTLMEIEHQKSGKSVIKTVRELVRFLMGLWLIRESAVEATVEEAEAATERLRISA